MKFFQQIGSMPPQTSNQKALFMWGKIRYNKQKGTWAVSGTWQGKRYYFSQMPTHEGLVPCESERMAKRLREMISVEIDNGNFTPEKYKASKPLILQNYAQRWIERKKVSDDLSTATLYDYENSLNRHILPLLGHKYLPDINADDLEDLQAAIKRSPKGKKNVLDCLKQVFKAAKRAGHITQIPEFPDFKGKNKVVKPPIKYISQQDQMLVIENIPVQHRPIFLFMMATGCRPSEARALRKSDIQGEWIMFENAFGRKEELKPVKQGKAEAFPITEEIRAILDMQPKSLSEWVFPNPDTGNHYKKNLCKIWNKACERAGVQKIKLYNATRHSFACQLINSGVDKSVVSRLLRHADPKMVERYTEYEMHPLRSAIENVRKVDFGVDKAGQK